MFFTVSAFPSLGSVFSAIMLTLVIVLGILATFQTSRLLSKTLLKGIPSSYTLELPPYRRPMFIPVIVRSIFDRTIVVLGRAITFAAPAGILIWVLANVSISGVSLLAHFAAFLDPLGRLMGMDGMILCAFILGFPANEIVIPIMMMGYMSSGTLTELTSIVALKELFVANGWTHITALCTLIFFLMHWPCSTTCLTIFKETKSAKWTFVAFILPALCGGALCIIISTAARIFGLS